MANQDIPIARVERDNGNIKDMLVVWMSENETNDWYIGIKLVQFTKTLPQLIEQTHYFALFGMETQIEVLASSLPNNVLDHLQPENDLMATPASPSFQSES